MLPDSTPLPSGVYSINENTGGANGAGTYQIDTDTQYGRSSVLFDPNNPTANASAFASLGISSLLPSIHSYLGIANPPAAAPTMSAPIQTAYAPGVTGTPLSQGGAPVPASTPAATSAAPSYGNGYYVDPGSGAYFQKSANGQVSIVTNSATIGQLKGGAISATKAAYTDVASSGTPVGPAVTTIGSTVAAPSGGSTSPEPSTGTAASVADQFNTSLATTITGLQTQLQSELATQTATYQTKIDALNTQSSNDQQLEAAGLSNENATVQQETAAKQAALDQEQQEFQQNYQARQQLTDQLSTLLTTGQTVIQQMQATTGLSSIMSPRISQTMTDVQAQAGVITAALSAYSDQIGLAQNQLQSATAAITSIYGDQLTYWNSVISFYNDQQKSTDAEVASLTNEQKTYIDAQVTTLQDKVTSVQNTAAAIQTAMLNPTTALAYAKAGVSLTDSPEQIAQKLATYEAAQPASTKAGSTTTASTANSKGTMSNKQFVELSLQRAGLDYNETLAKVPTGKVGVVDNATGQIGYIDPTEYNTKQYTYL